MTPTSSAAGRPRPRPGCVLAAALLLLGAPAVAGTTYDDGPALAQRLLEGVVRVSADEHGFGLVVGADGEFVYVATARHVVGAVEQVAVRSCSEALPADLAAERVAGFDAQAHDLALLRFRRPAGYVVNVHVLAPAGEVAVGDAAWLLGRDDTCAVLPRPGAVAALPNERALWRADMPGVLGGSSGAPVATGRGILGLTTDSDNANITVIDIALVAQRVQAAALAFQLVGADNIPPGDPQAAERDLAEMLDRFLFALRDAQTVLRGPTVRRDYFTTTVTEYNVAAKRFRDAKDKYDGTLQRHWEAGVAQEWSALRDRLWAAHQNFLFVNAHAQAIVETERVPDAVRERMAALEPELAAVQRDIAHFLLSVNQRRVVHANTSN
ncbi:serine protease [Pseudorhodoferax sp. Leaf274]|uniref:S1 family peptidase n=1 Tax=Pseudorhodoferax sp. Leaf274 TaxID=1736318 RepID=UPI000703301A|nr:serine protease [Pseudorhodoferax sp. Leaf274]KQP43299.1 hypothetical protein ASF44_06965 [Pseudorhodoferax sp. Leaf274]